MPVMSNHSCGVTAGLVPAIHAFLLKAGKKGVDARDKRGHDGARGDSVSLEHDLGS